jgi:hypothetical protein
LAWLTAAPALGYMFNTKRFSFKKKEYIVKKEQVGKTVSAFV